MRVLSLVAVVAGLILVPAAQAADAWPVPRGPSREPDPYTTDVKKPPAIPREFLDDASACILYAASTYRLEADGTVETTTHEVTRLNGRKGVEKLGEHRGVSWDPAYEKVTLHLARVHKPDGTVVEATPRDAQVRDVGTDYQVYDTDKQLIITFPTLGVGDVLEVKWTVRGRNPEYKGHLFRRYSFGDTEYPIVRDELRVLLPKERELKYACVFGDVKPAIREVGADRYFHWRADDCKPVPKDDGLPSDEELRPNVSFSTFASWDEVGKWKQQLREKCWECTVDVKKVVEDVTKGITDPVAKARALTHWMRHNIRYVSIGAGHHYTPHLPGQILANRYGDCKDGSQLLAVMLREAGLRVELATLGIRDDGQVLADVPSPWGTHAILVVTIDGKMHWIDTTSNLSGWDQLPHGDCDRMTYLVDDAGKIRLVKTPAMTPEQNRIDQATRMYVGNDGKTRFERTVTAHGLAALYLRDDLLEVPVGERRRKITSELQDSFSSARLLELTVDEAALRDLDGPVKMRVVFEVEDHFRRAANDERDGNVSDSKIWGRLLSWTLDYDRKAAFELFAPFESKHHFEVFLPPAYTLESVPRARKHETPWASFQLTVAPPGDADVAFTMTTRINKLRVEPAEFDKFRDFQAEVNRAYRVWLTMQPIEELEDAPLVEALLHFLPEDGDAAAILAKVYDTNGRKADAARVLKRSLAYAPDNKTLLEMAYELCPLEEEEGHLRKLIALFPNEVKYQLDLGASLVSRDQRDAARKVLDPVLKNGTPQQQVDARYQLARGHYRVDALLEAEKELLAAEKADPAACEKIRFRTLQGQVAEELKKPDEARKYFELALRLNDKAAFPREALVRLAVARKDVDEAMKHLRQMMAHHDGDADEMVAIAEYAFRLERLADAEEFARQAERLKPSDKGRRLLGLIEMKRGAAEKALPLLEKAGNDPIALEALITARLALGQIDPLAAAVARAELRPDDLALRTAAKRARKLEARRDELLKLVPADEQKTAIEVVGVVACLEEAALEIRVPERARTLLAKAVELAPRSGLVLAWKAKLDLEQGKLARAAADADAAVAATPAYWVGHYVRGVCALEREKGDAVAALRQAAKLTDEKDAAVLFALGRALVQAGKAAEGRAELEKAARIQPDLEDLKPLLESLRGGQR